MLNSFSSDDGQRSDFRDLLPFPGLAKGEESTEEKASMFTKETTAEIKKMIEAKILHGIPAAVFRSVLGEDSFT